MSRAATRGRSTKETSIRIAIDLDGTGKVSVSTGLPFYDHMLEQIGRHGGFDLTVEATGDLHIDSHHTVEDVAIALGYWAATYLPLRSPSGAAPITDDPAEVLVRAMAIPALRDAPLHPLLWQNMRDAAATAWEPPAP